MLLISGFSIIGTGNDFEEPSPNTPHHSYQKESHNTRELVKMARELFSQKSVSVKELLDEFSPLLSSNGFEIAQALSIIVYEEIGTRNNLDVVSKCFASIKAMNLLINPEYFSKINQKLDSLKSQKQHTDFIAAVESDLNAFLKSMKVEQNISWKVIRNDEYLHKKVTSCQSYSQTVNNLSDYEKVLLAVHHQQQAHYLFSGLLDDQCIAITHQM